MRLLALMRESMAASLAAPLVSAVVVVIVAAMCASITMTSGRAVAAQSDVMTTLEQAGTREITVSARGEARIPPSTLELAASVEAIEWVAASEFIGDVTNSSLRDGQPVAMHRLWVSSLDFTHSRPLGAADQEIAVAPLAALETLGLSDGNGQVVTSEGDTYEVVGPVDLPPQLSDLGSSILLLAPPASLSSIDTVTIRLTHANEAELVSKVLASAWSVQEQGSVSISTSKQLGEVRDTIERQLTGSHRGLAVASAGVSGALCCAITTLSVLHKRRDFGRRRALGATRAVIASLILTQTLLLSSVGALLGSVISVVWLSAADSIIATPEVTMASILLSISVAILAGVLPAVIASRRDPGRELRTP